MSAMNATGDNKKSTCM